MVGSCYGVAVCSVYFALGITKFVGSILVGVLDDELCRHFNRRVKNMFLLNLIINKLALRVRFDPQMHFLLHNKRIF